MTEYSARLATRITPDARKRLKVAAAVREQSISATLTDVLTRALPCPDGPAELADQLRSQELVQADADGTDD